MKLKIFTIYDVKSETYLQPFYMKTKGEAIRGFYEALNDPQTTFAKYPADFTLFEIGEFDDLDCSIASHSVKIPHGNGLEIKSLNANP